METVLHGKFNNKISFCIIMSKPTDNIDTSAGITQEDITDVVLTTFEVFQDGPPIKRMKLDDTVWTSTELLLQPETSNGSVLDVQNVAGSSLFNVNTSTPLTRSDAPMVIDVTSTEALLVRKDADAEDIFVVDTSTPVVRSDAPTIIDMGSTSAFQVRQAVGVDPTFIVDTIGTGDGLSNITQRAKVKIDYFGNEIFGVYSTFYAYPNPLFSIDAANALISMDASLEFTNPFLKASDTLTLSSSPSYSLTLNYLNIAGTIHVTWNATTFTGSGTLSSFGLDTIPSYFRPASGSVEIPCRFLNNGTNEMRVIRIQTTGVVTIRNAASDVATVTTSGTLYGGGGSYKKA
jgi:hypothetical protein